MAGRGGKRQLHCEKRGEKRERLTDRHGLDGDAFLIMSFFRVVTNLFGKDIGVAERVDERCAARTRSTYRKGWMTLSARLHVFFFYVTDDHQGELESFFHVFSAAA